jgi:hypothetical protein
MTNKYTGGGSGGGGGSGDINVVERWYIDMTFNKYLKIKLYYLCVIDTLTHKLLYL